MARSLKHWSRLMVFVYTTTLVWQIVWLAVLPEPAGPQSIWLALIACVPLLLPYYGIVRRIHSSMVLGGIVLMLYLTIGITQIWTNPAHLWPATVQVLLVISYVLAFRMHNKAA